MNEERRSLLVELRWPLAVLLLAVVALFGYWLTLYQAARGARAVGDAAAGAADRIERMAGTFFTGDVTERFVSSMPKVERTDEGRLEVASMEITESLRRTDERRMLWDLLSLGRTTVEIEVPVTYRYYVRLEDEWKVEIHGPVALVEAPAIRPTLPPAIHTDRMRVRTEEDLLRFDVDEREDEARRSLTPRLSQRAASDAYVDLVREEARRRVARFVRQWLLDQDFWTDDRFATIKVRFADEVIESSLDAPDPESVRVEEPDAG